ncbi:MAG: hypothetical protein ACRYHB_05960 [Janthinobacterium lividum]
MPRIAQVDPRFQSYNVEMVEVIGGRFWKPYGSAPVKTMPAPVGGVGIDPNLFEQRAPADLGNPRLRMLAAALGPAYLRVSGSWANTVYFQDNDELILAKPPTGFAGVLSRAEWKGVADFAAATDSKIVTSFGVGAGTRDAKGLWTPNQAEAFLKYTNSIGAPIAAAEFMNEPSLAGIANLPEGYDGAAYGRDFAVFKIIFRKDAPKALLLGPGSSGEGLPTSGGGLKLLPTNQLLNGTGAGDVDAFSYHVYPAISERCAARSTAPIGTSQADALTTAFLERTNTVESFYADLRNRYAPGKAMWLTETGQSACGGDPWAATFLDSFRYLYQLGSLASRNVQVVMHNTLAASDYGLVDQNTLRPRPNYWSALLWHYLMGTVVLKVNNSSDRSVPVFAQCMKGRPGGVTVLALNLDRSAAHALQVPLGSTRYTMTAASLPGDSVLLNGAELKLTESGSMPRISGVAAKAGAVELPPASITFLAMPTANNAACR